MSAPVVDFWFEFASTYSYPAAMRIADLAATAGVTVRWRPFLLGPIFRAHGWDTSPFVLYPAKGRYMWRDLERICDEAGLRFQPPDPFPQSSVLAARIAIVAFEEGFGADFARAVYQAEFADGRPIADAQVMADLLAGLGVEAQPVLDRAQSDPTKLKLREQTEEASRRGIFGAPTFITADGELFWGNDRLETALAWAARAG